MRLIPKKLLGRVLFGLFMLLLAFVGWLGLSGYQAYSELNALRSDLSTATSADDLTASDLAEAIGAARTHMSAAASAVHNPAWALLAKLPLIGNSATALLATTEAGSTVLEACSVLEDRLGKLPASTGISIDTETLDALAAGGKALLPGLRTAAVQMSQVNLAGVPSPLATPVAELRDVLSKAVPQVQQLPAFTVLAPSFFGLQEPTTWLLVLANGAEARPAGGFPGGFGLLTASAGKLTLTNLESNDRLSKHSLSDWETLSGFDSAALYGDDMSRLMDMGLSPDFEVSGRLLWNLYKRYTPGTSPDGVLQLDEYALTELLRVSGPVATEGHAINADNAVDFVTRGVYESFPNPKDKDRVLISMALQIFAKLNSPSVSTLQIAKALFSAMGDHRVHAWLADPVKQSAIRNTDLSGGVHNTKAYSHIVAIANGGGNKLEAYIQYNIAYTGGKCDMRTGYRDSALDINIDNQAPSSGLPRYVTARLDKGITDPVPQGGTREIIFVHVPAGSELTRATFDGVEVQPLVEGVENGRWVWRFDVEVTASSQSELRIAFSEPVFLKARQVRLWAQPMVRPTIVQSQPGPDC